MSHICGQVKISIPYGKQETGTPFYSVYLKMSCGGAVITCMYIYSINSTMQAT